MMKTLDRSKEVNMIYRFFDFESYPNWWCCSFGDIDIEQPDWNNIDEQTCKANMVTVTSDDKYCRDVFFEHFTKDVCMVGYNIKFYDLMIANAVYQGFTPRQVNKISNIIINRASDDKESYMLRSYAHRRISGFTYLDMFDDNTGSLKEKENILGMDIRETEVQFDKEDLTDEDKESIIMYNKHDVYASMVYFSTKQYQAYLTCKLTIGEKFNFDSKTVHTSTNPQLTCMAVGAKKTEFIDEERIDITLPMPIEAYCYENCPKAILEYVLNNKSGKAFKYFENNISVADGGMHSTYPDTWSAAAQKRRDDRKLLYVASDETYMLVNVDGKSYYPSLMIFLKLLSRAVQNPSIFKGIFDDRMDILAMDNIPDKLNLLQLAYKLVLNSMSGASDCSFLAAYDKYMTSRMRRVGEIFLISLANKITTTIKGSKIIQGNTDGLLVYLPRAAFDTLETIMQEWHDVSGITLELDYVDKIWQKDVNNYLLIKKGGKVKRKGSWLNDSVWKNGIKTGPFDAFVCAKAVIEYLAHDKNIIQSIVNNTNIEDFIITCKQGPTFDGTVQRYSNGFEEELFKSNRVIAVREESYGMIYKYKVDENGRHYTKMPDIPEHCVTLNDALKNYKFDELKAHIDYSYYLDRCEDLLHYQVYQLCGNELFKTNQFNYFDI